MMINNKPWVFTINGIIILILMISTMFLSARRRFVFGFSSNTSSMISKQQHQRNDINNQKGGFRIWMSSSSSSSTSSSSSNKAKPKRGKLLVLGGTGFLGQTICKRANLEGYSVTSLSRRGLPSPSSNSIVDDKSIDYRMGDARNIECIQTILKEGGYVGKNFSAKSINQSRSHSKRIRD